MKYYPDHISLCHLLSPSKLKITFKVEMNESADYLSHEFDYQADFTQFLEEARKNAVQIESDVTTEEKKQLNLEKKKRKSWKSSLFSWLRNDKKSESLKQASNTTTMASKARRAHVSGPVMVGVAAARVQRAASGPLTGIFGSTGTSEEPEVPYMCLSQLNKQRVHSYGPVYLVT